MTIRVLVNARFRLPEAELPKNSFVPEESSTAVSLDVMLLMFCFLLTCFTTAAAMTAISVIRTPTVDTVITVSSVDPVWSFGWGAVAGIADRVWVLILDMNNVCEPPGDVCAALELLPAVGDPSSVVGWPARQFIPREIV